MLDKKYLLPNLKYLIRVLILDYKMELCYWRMYRCIFPVTRCRLAEGRILHSRKRLFQVPWIRSCLNSHIIHCCFPSFWLWWSQQVWWDYLGLSNHCSLLRCYPAWCPDGLCSCCVNNLIPWWPIWIWSSQLCQSWILLG